MDVSMTDHGRVPPTLDTLPSELRKLIVSFLAPAYLYPGSKQALKNANLAQRCLREWVPEYLFRDMALLHVMTGITSHLEYFTTHPDTADYTRYVKRVVIKVPPGLRWEVGTEGPRRSRLANTMQRFCSKFHVQSVDEMSTEQNTYCQLYHRAMVEPFIDSMRWPRLVSSAQTWGRVLNSLENLETVEVGCCERVDHPWPTVTHHFVQQHGKDVVRAEQPAYVEDDTINKGWASLLLVTIPINALTYKLTWAQTDNLTTWATVNRLLGMGYDLASRTSIVNDMKRLTLTLEGAYGTHGSRDWQGTTGTAAGVRFWQSALNKMPNLAHLTLCNQTTPDDEKLFTGLGMTNIRGNVMDWFLPGLNPPSLRTLRLQDFAFDKATVSSTFKSMKTFLNTLILDDCILVDWEEETEGAALDEALLLHIQGGSWADFSQDLKNHHPGRLIKLIRPLSRIHKGNEYRLHPKSVEQITRYEGVALNIGGSYNSLVNNPPDHINMSVANAETLSELSRSS